MTKMEFARKVASTINETTQYTAEVKEITKNNGVIYTGIWVADGTNVTQVVYIDQEYANGVTVEDAAEMVLNVTETSTPPRWA